MRTIFFTGKGDRGTSRLGRRPMPKDDPLFELLGSLDRLNSWLGLCRVEAQHAVPKKNRKGTVSVAAVLLGIQEALFIVQAEVAAGALASRRVGRPPRATRITAAHTAFLEDAIRDIDRTLPPLRKFVIPGGSELAARLDVARTYARDAERAAVRYHRRRLTPELLTFLNRLSSVLFALARYVNHRAHVRERHPTYA